MHLHTVALMHIALVHIVDSYTLTQKYTHSIQLQTLKTEIQMNTHL